MSARDRERVLQEIYALAAQGDNAHAVRYYGAWEEDDVVYIQMELCSGTIEREWLAPGGRGGGEDGRPLDAQALCMVAAHAASALAHMHRHGMVHLDVKPSNLYRAMSGVVKLGDFGNARAAEGVGGGVSEGDSDEDEGMGGVQGAEGWGEIAHGDRRYVAPEVLAGRRGGSTGWYAADVFSLGACLLEVAGRRRLPSQGEGFSRVREGGMSQVTLVSTSISTVKGVRHLRY